LLKKRGGGSGGDCNREKGGDRKSVDQSLKSGIDQKTAAGLLNVSRGSGWLKKSTALFEAVVWRSDFLSVHDAPLKWVVK